MAINKIGQFVTAKTKDGQIRQGAIIRFGSGEIEILGESGERYTCKPQVTIVTRPSYHTSEWCNRVAKGYRGPNSN